MKIFFATKNKHKYEELKNIVEKRKALLKKTLGFDLELELYDKLTMQELQTDSPEELVRGKVLGAFKKIQRPVLVEHTALYINAFKRLPGLQTKHFYDKLNAQGIIEYCSYKKDFKVEAVTWLGFCNGEKIEIVQGKLDGWFVNELPPEGNWFDWDSIFIPDIMENVDKKTFVAMGRKKDEISMRKSAWEMLEKKLPEMCRPIESYTNYQDAVNELAALIRDHKVLLFLGAGISASMKLPDWGTLLGEMGKELGYDEEVFKTYGDYMVLAEYAKNRRKEEWEKFFDNKFAPSNVSEYKKELRKNEIYQIIADLDFPVIYTTNYDRILEDYFAEENIPFRSIVEIGQMDNIKSGDTRIIKFHGDIKNPGDKVLSESEYFERMDFDDFRDIQLQADLLQYHVFFLGYSLSDINVRLMLYRAGNRWKKQGGGKKAFIFSVTPNQVRAEVFLQNNIVTINGDQADKEAGTLQFLRDLRKAKESY